MALSIKLFFALLFPLMLAEVVHHGWANYDQTTTLDYTGTVEQITYENPHAMLKLRHNDKS